MVTLTQLTTYLNDLLQINTIQDFAPNGLQVEGQPEITRIVTGVSANQALLQAALDQKAQAILVHHGYFWKGDQPQITGCFRERLATLLKNDMSLLAYHLPLDLHPVYGNNAQLAALLDMTIEGTLPTPIQPDLGLIGRLNTPMSGAAFAAVIAKQLDHEPLHVPGHADQINRVAWCTGAAHDFIEHAAREGVDAYITGEAAERTYPLACELGIHFYAAGHHATERGGVRALGAHVQEKFGVDVEFVDVANPV